LRVLADARPSCHLQATAAEHLGAFIRERQYRVAAIAHRLAERLTGADHDGNLALKTHFWTSVVVGPLSRDDITGR
jgi:hypothetical protein